MNSVSGEVMGAYPTQTLPDHMRPFLPNSVFARLNTVSNKWLGQEFNLKVCINQSPFVEARPSD